MNGLMITQAGRKLALNRIFKAVPDYAAPTVFSVGTGASTPMYTDGAMEAVVQIAGSDTKILVAGYPIIDELTFQASFRCLVLTTECNGNDLVEFGLLNTDVSPVLFSRTVYTAITKTSDVQIIYIEKDKLEV
jgi:hypothetical protein